MWERMEKLAETMWEASQNQFLEKSVWSGQNRQTNSIGMWANTTSVEIQVIGADSGATHPWYGIGRSATSLSVPQVSVNIMIATFAFID